MHLSFNRDHMPIERSYGECVRADGGRLCVADAARLEDYTICATTVPLCLLYIQTTKRTPFQSMCAQHQNFSAVCAEAELVRFFRILPHGTCVGHFRTFHMHSRSKDASRSRPFHSRSHTEPLSLSQCAAQRCLKRRSSGAVWSSTIQSVTPHSSSFIHNRL